MNAVRGDVITGIAVTLIGVIYYIATFWIQETKNIVTPRTFPAIVGVALIVRGLFLAGQALYRGRKLAEAAPGSAVSAVGARTGGSTSVSGDDDAAAASADKASGAASARAAASGATASGVVLDAPEDPPSKKVVLQFALFFVYLAILIPVGFLLSTTAFLMTMTSIYARDRWVRNLIFSLLFSVVIYLAFVYGLAVYLPVGILG